MEEDSEAVTENMEDGVGAHVEGFIVPSLEQEEKHAHGKGLEIPGKGQ